ncbi:MAG: DUF2075 domain-containing protein [Bacteroidales bacterium]|nr:DUF2075 domain-containing protein [Bacteroidales bacterium]
MASVPIIFTTPEDLPFIGEFRQRIIQGTHDSKYLLNYPVVYLHYWPSETITYTKRNGEVVSKQKYDVYVGESNDIIQRTNEHFSTGRSDKTSWQRDLVKQANSPQIIVIGHEHFNKSFTLDIENRLIEYMLAMPKSIRRSLNGRGNPQNSYFPSQEFDAIFSKIWAGLRKQKRDLFLSEAEITDSALFKSSPLKKLTQEQIIAKERILFKVKEAFASGKDGQLIFVQGEAGTGKTVLTTSTFYELIKRGGEKDDEGKELFPKMSCYLMVNHDQQVHVYEQMSERLDLGKNIVSRPTTFINNYSPEKKVDVAFIDEGHLLWTQGKQSYRGSNQLQDIIDRSRVTVIMFDEYQVLTTEEYWEPSVLEKFRKMSQNQGNYIQLSNQLRMQCSQSTSKWLENFILNRKIDEFVHDNKYEVRSFDDPASLHEAIKKLSLQDDNKLSRVVASYDWAYKAKKAPKDKDFWDVQIDGWSKPWNYELEKTLDKKEKKAIKHLAWAEQEHTIDEVGSTFTIQGFDLSYVGVILGPSVKYRDGKIVFDPRESKNDKATRFRTLSDNTKKRFGEILIRNEIKVLLTRGVKGLYIYACDDELRDALRRIAKI